jgi:hypothetical protein
MRQARLVGERRLVLRQNEALLSDVSTRIEEKSRALVMLRSELPESRARWIAENNPVCPICAVPIDKAVAEGCGISTATCDLHALQHQIANLKGNVDREAQDILDLEGQRSSLQYNLGVARQHLKPLEQTVAALERSLLDQSNTVRAVQRLVDDADRYEKLLIDRANLMSSLERATALLASRRDELSAHRQAARESIARLSFAFDAVLRELVPSNIEGEAKLDGNGLTLSAKLDGERSTAAIDSLKVVAFDLAALFLTLEGHTHLPAFLLHDSPREADLGRSIYDRLFEFGRKLESFGPTPLFQYIVTTTTEPPREFHSEPWLRLTLRGTPASERLLKIDL